jgi:hypothetical protein
VCVKHQTVDIQHGGFNPIIVSSPNNEKMPPNIHRSDHTIDLTESAGWVLTSNGGIVSKPDIIRLLSKLSSIRIR